MVVGGGVAGLYAAYLLGRHGLRVQLFEASDHWGGRIDSRSYPVDGKHDFIAEFGAMRFEADLQERLRGLCFHLGIEFEEFSPTRAPTNPTHHDLTETEQSFESVLDLLEWAILRMFFDVVDDDLVAQLAAIENDKHTNVGSRQLAALKLYMDANYFCVVTVGDDGPTVKARSDEDIQNRLMTLRKDATLRGKPKATRLADLGLWNALSEVVSPGALARIRDNGTFYHLIAENPSALEWGIFWLRQCSVMGGLSQFTRATAPEGTQSLITKLKQRIADECGSLVRLMPEHEVVSIERGKDPDELLVSVRCRDGTDDGYSLDQRADHVVLALPKQPLQALDKHFPHKVRERLEDVEGLPLLKAFLVTKKPWWQPGLEAQTFAWLVPTRELHFFRPERDARKTRLSDKPPNIGMVMLYTDQPALRYWQPLMTTKQRGETTWRICSPGSAANDVRTDPDGLLAMLIRRLILIPDPGLARNINLREQQIKKYLKRRDQRLARRVDNESGGTHGFAEQIFRATSRERDRMLIAKVLEKAGITQLDRRWRSWLARAIEYARFEHDPEQTAKCATRVRAYGIRDWSAPPFGGAAHFWLPRSHCVTPTATSRDVLIAFGLQGREGGVENVHICGEAYSDFQGFIEGALRTAEEVVEAILPGQRTVGAVFSIDPTLRAKEHTWCLLRNRRLAAGLAKLREDLAT